MDQIWCYETWSLQHNSSTIPFTVCELCDEFAFSLICYSNLDEPGSTKLEMAEIRSNENLCTNNFYMGPMRYPIKVINHLLHFLRHELLVFMFVPLNWRYLEQVLKETCVEMHLCQWAIKYKLVKNLWSNFSKVWDIAMLNLN